MFKEATQIIATEDEQDSQAACALIAVFLFSFQSFYRAMHFSAKRGIAIACRLSVRPSVCLSVCL